MARGNWPDHGRNGPGVAWRAILYGLLVLLPLLSAIVSGDLSGEPGAETLGRTFAIVGMAILMLQPVLASRFHWVEKPFGLDRLLRIHRTTGMAAGALLLLHPLALALGARGFGFLVRAGLPWFLVVARGTLLFMILFALAALFRGAMKLPFQWWLRFHGGATPLILVGAFLHSWAIAVRYQSLPSRWIWTGLFGFGMVSWLHLMLVQRLGGRSKAYSVKEVTALTPNVWNLVLAPPDRAKRLEYLPGQFLFVTLLRAEGLPREEHPFTISSSPTRRDAITITCKASGDFTATLGQTRPGDRAVVNAPFGRFSHLLRRESERLVFIAGGIGITPFMSMLRYIRDTGDDREVLLICANRSERDIVFREELSAMEALSRPVVSVVHVLSRPDPEWKGEKGYADGAFLKRVVGDVTGKLFFICGPPPMMDGVAGALAVLGVPPEDVNMERFAL